MTSLDQLLPRLHRLAQDALPLWDIPEGATVSLINVSENVTYLVEGPNAYKAVLRVHRTGYHSRRAVACELAWIDALTSTNTIPHHAPIMGRDGKAIQTASTANLKNPRMLVLFHHIDGITPSEDTDLTAGFTTLGQLAARCHTHALTWPKPQPFERLTWDADAVFGATPTWGNWRDAPHVDVPIRQTLERVETKVKATLKTYGQSPTRFNLIHADMRLANLLVTPGQTHLIDFDDCGMGWFMYDFAAAISFIEDDPRVPALRAAWLAGYRSVRPLDAADEALIDTMIMLRRLALLAWIGSHLEAPEPQALAPDFARVTAQLGQRYLDQL